MKNKTLAIWVSNKIAEAFSLEKFENSNAF